MVRICRFYVRIPAEGRDFLSLGGVAINKHSCALRRCNRVALSRGVGVPLL